MTDTATLSASTRVWVYQSHPPFAKADVPAVLAQLRAFAREWISHNQQLRAHADLLHERFIVLMVDESQAGASGCSIDSSVRFLKALQTQYGVDLFDRLVFSYLDGEQAVSVGREEFARRFVEGIIHDDTPVFDTLVSNKSDFDQGFIKPLRQSWHKRMV
jgi:hypothetical protein